MDIVCFDRTAAIFVCNDERNPGERRQNAIQPNERPLGKFDTLPRLPLPLQIKMAAVRSKHTISTITQENIRDCDKYLTCDRYKEGHRLPSGTQTFVRFTILLH